MQEFELKIITENETQFDVKGYCDHVSLTQGYDGEDSIDFTGRILEMLQTAIVKKKKIKKQIDITELTRAIEF